MGKFETYPEATTLENSDITLYNKSSITHKVTFGRLVSLIKSKIAESGLITSINTGAGLTGGEITSSGTIKCKLKSEVLSSLASTSVSTTADRQYPVNLDRDGNLSVNVPWAGDTYIGEKGVTVANNKISATLKNNTPSSLSSASMGSTADRQYAVGLDVDGKLSVNIPWTDTVGMTTNGSNADSHVNFAGAFTIGSRKSGSTVGTNSTAEGDEITASGNCSHAEGNSSTASAKGAHAEGNETEASGIGSHAEGYQTVASAHYCHAEGRQTQATSTCTHAEGKGTISSSNGSHAEGWETTASGSYSHSEGYKTTAIGVASHAGGWYAVAPLISQFVHGGKNKKFNESSDDYLGVFGFQPEGQHYTADTVITDSYNGKGGTANADVTVRLSLKPCAIYMLCVAVYGTQDWDSYGSLFMITTPKASVQNPYPQVSNIAQDWVEISEESGNVIAIECEYDYTFHLIRII